MKKNRYLLCLLAAGALGYYALPRLPIHEGGFAGTFAIIWLAFCLLVIAGNLSALLYAPKRAGEGAKLTRKPIRRKRRLYN